MIRFIEKLRNLINRDYTTTIDYPLMEPPFEMKDFEEMSKSEAKQYYQWYIQEIPKRIEILKKALSSTSNQDIGVLDFSPNSLIPIWYWFIPQVIEVPMSSKEIREELLSLPEWLHDDISRTKLSTGTLAIAMDIAIYFAEVFIRNNKLNWGLLSTGKRNADYNQPIIEGFDHKITMNPRRVLHVLTSKVADKLDISPNALYDLYYVWTEDIKEENK